MSAIITKHANATVEVFGKHYTRGQFLPFYVPRDRMPQVDEQYTIPMIIDAAKALPIALPTLEVVEPHTLRAHQRIDHGRAKAMSDDVRAKPIVVSDDNYVVDGNHRWWSHVHQNSTAIAIIRLAHDFDEAIDWLKTLPYIYEITPGTPIRN